MIRNGPRGINEDPSELDLQLRRQIEREEEQSNLERRLSTLSFESVASNARLLDFLGLDDPCLDESRQTNAPKPPGVPADQFRSLKSRLGKQQSAPALRRMEGSSFRPTHKHTTSNPLVMTQNGLCETPVSGHTNRRFTSQSLIPEDRVSLAVQLRNTGNAKEASYQLQIAANQGSRDAMLLYGLSLRYGYGVRKDEKASFLWLCRSADLELDFKFEIDPFDLKKPDLPAKLPEPLAPALFEVGVSYIRGMGTDKDELLGIQIVEKAASLGYVDAMCQAGQFWSKKSHHRKKNLHRAAAWFRLAEQFGAKLIGNSWIYKPKYT